MPRLPHPAAFRVGDIRRSRSPKVDGIVDNGREEITERPEDRGKFRTVTLRNIAFTEPYFHNGTVNALEDAVRHELAQGKQPFTDEDVRLITVFIGKALRDESRRGPPWVPAKRASHSARRPRKPIAAQ